MATPSRQPIRNDLKSAPWLKHPALTRVLAALNSGGGETRIIGGAVRNGLLDEAVADIDLATQLTPDDVIRRAAKSGIATYPTGIDHGTVTVVADGHSFEVTTLRRDIETDGRHAVVAFTTDWHIDALRRDFTINALSADADGNVFDTVGGIDDLKNRRVRFIGDATGRIREDYLRILRFFRFTSAYAEGEPDAQGLAAAVDLKSGMQQLSAERIGAEMMKFIVTPRAGEIARVMQASGIFETLIPLAAHPERLIRMQAIELALDDKPDEIARLAALFLNIPADAQTLAQNFRFSSADLAALTAAADVNEVHNSASSDQAAKEQIYRAGAPAFGRAIRVAWSRSAAPIPDEPWIEKCRLAATWRPPQMPVSGADVMALGIPTGPRIGRTLRAFEAWWVAAEFASDPALQKAKLAELAAQT